MSARPVNLRLVGKILRAAKALALQYRNETGRPLGITGEVAEYEAARLLDLKLMPARQAGYDATRKRGNRTDHIQIKARCILNTRSQRIGKINLKHTWHYTLLVLLDGNLDVTAIYEATRKRVKDALEAPGSKSRNERGALPVSKFKAIGRKVWPTVKGARR